MKEFLAVIAMIAGTIGSLLVSKIIFDLIVNSDLPLFWKWIFLN